MKPTRDYYADLELPPTADVQDIKKQFRKLALIYHPDRNPGREQEVNAKFQIIQSAHEVLTDPQQKSKYDATLGRNNRFPAASGVKGNPWQNVGQQFPAPPRRSAAPRNNTSGAQRWQTRFSNGVPPTAKQQASTDSEAKKNAARAFENMRKAQPSSSKDPSSQPSPRSESARQRAQAAFGSSRKTGFQPRSAVPGDEPPVSSRNYSSRADREPSVYSTHTQNPRAHTMPDPLSQFRDEGSHSRPRQSAPYTSNGGEKTSIFGDDASSSSESHHGQTHHNESSASGEGPTQDQVPRCPDPPHPASDAMGGTGSNFGHGLWSGQSKPFGAHSQTIPPFVSEPGTGSNPDMASTSGGHQGRNAFDFQPAGGSGPSIFQFSVGKDAPTASNPAQFSKKNVDEINTSFVTEEASGSSAWKFNAGKVEQDNVPEGRPPPDRRSSSQSSNIGKADPHSHGPTTAPPPPPPPGSEPQVFNAKGWSDKFGPQTFVPQPTHGASASPSRTNRLGSKKAKSKPTASKASVVEEISSDEEAWEGRQTQERSAKADSPQAMDIDSPPVAPTLPPRQPSKVRNIKVEPSRPEWRQEVGDSGMGNAKRGTGAEKPTATVEANSIGSEDNEDFKASFADLKNVAPFAQPRAGLQSFAELKDNLPFESKASDSVPMRVPKTQPLNFPEPPVAPRLPPTVAIQGMKQNLATWNQYLAAFQIYLRQWDEFNAQVVDHFATRKAHVAQIRKAKGYGFLGARGDSDVEEYYHWVQQDNQVGQLWNAACEEHEKRFGEFMTFRNKMK